MGNGRWTWEMGDGTWEVVRITEPDSAVKCSNSWRFIDPDHENQGAPLVDDRPVDARGDHQLPDAEHARRRGADAHPGPAHHHAAVLVDRRHVPGRDHAAAARRLRARRARPEDRLRDLRRRVVAHQHGARAGAQLAGVRRAARSARARRGVGESGGHEGDVGVVSGEGARASPAASSTSARRSARCSRRRWSRGRSSPTTGRRRSSLPARSASCGSCCGCCSITRPRSIRRSRTAERDYIISGQEAHLQGDGRRPSIRTDPRAAELLGHRAAAVSRRSDVGHAHVLAAALLDHGPALRSETDRAVRAGCRSWPPTSAACSAARSRSRCRSTSASA